MTFVQTLAKDALISPCGTYRYVLERTWNPEKPSAGFIMLNPSTADADNDDPTIRRCIAFAKSWGCGGLIVLNLFAYRATDPKRLKLAVDPIGPDNDRWIDETVRACAPVVAAWGTHGTLLGRNKQVIELLGDELVCLGKTKDGHPRHPLYVKGDQELMPL